MARFALFALVVSSCVFPTICRAEIIIGSSVEWLTCEADVVVIGRVERIVTTRGPGAIVYDDCTVEVKEIIKGKVEGGRLIFCLRTVSAASPAKAWMKSPEPVLLFLSPSKRDESEKRLDGMLVPTNLQFPLSVIDLAAPGKYVLDTHFKVLTDQKAILETCRKSAVQLADHLKRNPGARVEARRLEVPGLSEAWHSLYAGSKCYVKAPVFVAKGQK
jgi:hypothetical protein